MPTWKRIFFKAMGFGAGAVLILALVAAVWYAYATRPRPWNKNAVKAKFNGFTYQAKQEAFEITFEYVLDNTTGNGTDMLTLSIGCGYIERVLSNSHVEKHLEKHHPDILGELRTLVAEIKPHKDRNIDTTGQ